MIAIVLLTCDRPTARTEYAKRALTSLANLRAGEELWLHVADDGSEERFRAEMIDRAREMFGDHASVTNAEGSGYGESYNLATQIVHGVADLILPVEDDWELVRPLNLRPIAAVLRDGLLGCVRMGYLGFTQELRAKFLSHGGLLWLALDPESPEPHVFAGGPRLETVMWERAVGPWLGGLEPGATEFEVAHRPAARTGVGWPVDLIHPRGDAFVHIGTEQAEMRAQPAGAEVPA